jgi:hypothetical protein
MSESGPIAELGRTRLGRRRPPFHDAELSRYDAAFWACEACVKATGIHRLVGGAAAWPADAAHQCPDSEVRIVARHTRLRTSESKGH